jgi:hypothetical protein
MEKKLGRVRFIGISTGYTHAKAIISQFKGIFDVVQVPETEWTLGDSRTSALKPPAHGVHATKSVELSKNEAWHKLAPRLPADRAQS